MVNEFKQRTAYKLRLIYDFKHLFPHCQMITLRYRLYTSFASRTVRVMALYNETYTFNCMAHKSQAKEQPATFGAKLMTNNKRAREFSNKTGFSVLLQVCCRTLICFRNEMVSFSV